MSVKETVLHQLSSQGRDGYFNYSTYPTWEVALNISGTEGWPINLHQGHACSVQVLSKCISICLSVYLVIRYYQALTANWLRSSSLYKPSREGQVLRRSGLNGAWIFHVMLRTGLIRLNTIAEAPYHVQIWSRCSPSPPAGFCAFFSLTPVKCSGSSHRHTWERLMFYFLWKWFSQPKEGLPWGFANLEDKGGEDRESFFPRLPMLPGALAGSFWTIIEKEYQRHWQKFSLSIAFLFSSD